MSEQPKFTLGPWNVLDQADGEHRETPRLISSNCHPDGTVHGNGTKNGGMMVANVLGPDKDANAALIAAAPDLFDALNDVAVALSAVLEAPHDETRRPHAQHLLERARAALTKAGAA